MDEQKRSGTGSQTGQTTGRVEQPQPIREQVKEVHREITAQAILNKVLREAFDLFMQPPAATTGLRVSEAIHRAILEMSNEEKIKFKKLARQRTHDLKFFVEDVFNRVVEQTAFIEG